MGNDVDNASYGATASVAPRVMVVDDDREIADLVASLLSREGMDAKAFNQPEVALQVFLEEPFDLAILDVMMPGMSGFEMCSRMRVESEVPVIFLSARDEETDQVVGLTLGADDYVCKPFKPRELVARVKAHLRRSRLAPSEALCSEILHVSGIVADKKAHSATLFDEPLSLTPKEFSILVHLMEHPNQPVAASDIYESAWREPFDPGAANTVMVHIRHLREKLSAIDSSNEYIETVWGVGYRMVPSQFDAEGTGCDGAASEARDDG